MKTVLLADVPVYQTVIKHVCMDVKYHLSVRMLLKKGACKLSVKTHQIMNVPVANRNLEITVCNTKIQKDSCVEVLRALYNTVGCKG